MRRVLLAAVVAGGVAGGAGAAGAVAEGRGTPLPARNLDPVVRLVGLPQPLGAASAAGERALSVQLDHANHFVLKQRPEAELLLDGATTVLTVAWRAGLGGGWEWGVDVPFVHHGGGFTDGFIDGFHDLFGFPDGDRDMRPRDALAFRARDRGRTVLDLADERQGLGDIRAWLGYRVVHQPGREVVLRAGVEAPTGKRGDLIGSDTTDPSLWLELVDARWLEALDATITAAAGFTAPGDLDLTAQHSRNVVYSGHFGLHYPLTHRLTLRAQLDGHSAVLDSRVPRLAEAALLGSVGGSITLASGARIDVAVVEDLTPGRSPDVVFQLRLAHCLR